MYSRHPFDLEQRTTDFAKNFVKFAKNLPRNSIIDPIINQAVRSIGSIGANYREANDALGRKDFIFRLRIVRKEVKESIHWLEVLEAALPREKAKITILIKEGSELRSIFSSMIYNSQGSKEKF